MKGWWETVNRPNCCLLLPWCKKNPTQRQNEKANLRKKTPSLELWTSFLLFNARLMLSSSHSGIGLTGKQTAAACPPPFLCTFSRFLPCIRSGQVELLLFHLQPFEEEEGVGLSPQKALRNVLRLLSRTRVLCVQAFVLKLFWQLDQTKLDVNDNPSYKLNPALRRSPALVSASVDSQLSTCKTEVIRFLFPTRLHAVYE